MTSPLCTHLIPEDQCMHCLTPALRVAIDALARERAEVARLKAERWQIREMIANDALAISFQTMGQYRSALIQAIKEIERAGLHDAALADYDPCASKDHVEAGGAP